MHILKIIHGYPPNYNAGSEVYSQSICNELAKTHKVSVLTREENPYLPDFSIRKETIGLIDFYFVNMAYGKDGYRHKLLDKNFENLIQVIKPDIVHIGHLNHLSTGIVDVLNEANIPIIYTLHDFWLMCPRGQFLQRNFDGENLHVLCDKQENSKCANTCYKMYHSGYEVPDYKLMYSEINHIPLNSKDTFSDGGHWTDWIDVRMDETKQIINKVDLFIAPSNYLRNRFINDFQVPTDKIIYLDYGFPTEYLTPSEKKLKSEMITFGYIGTHIPAKGVNLLIEAFIKLVQRTKSNAKLLIYGRENGQSTKILKQMANGYNIEFKGEYINKNLADEVFSNVDCIVVPSIWGENSPLVIHEAQACKIPVITADFGGMSEYVQHLVNGLLFTHRDIDSLSNQLQFAIENPEKMIELGKRGYLGNPMGEVPNIEDHCKELVKLYENLAPKMELNSFWRITLDTNPEDCNLKCTMCEEHSPFSTYIKETLGGKHRRMPKEWLEDIFIQSRNLGIKEVIPSTMGEPLIYKYFSHFIDLCYKYEMKMNLTTNGTFPKTTEKTVEEWAKLIVPITSDVKISWNGATAETSKKVMIGVDFDQTLENVKAFIKVRNQIFEETGYYCSVTFQLTFMQNNMHELADIVKLAAELGVDRVKGHHLWAHFEEIKDLSMKANEESIRKWNIYVKEALHAQEIYKKPNGEKVKLENIIEIEEKEKKEVPEHYECPFLNKELWISATGKISPCCAPDELRNGLGDFGNIENVTIEQAIQGENYQNLVKNYKQIELCKNCNMRKPK